MHPEPCELPLEFLSAGPARAFDGGHTIHRQVARLTLARIVSGGQTGVDRGALEAALAEGFPCGGWCPQGRAAEDGEIPARYPVSELTGAGYAERTLQNVIDSDGTAILYTCALEGGTRRTAEHCIERSKPHVVIDAGATFPHDAARAIADFVARHGVRVLNVAGPRASKWPGAHGYAFEAVQRVLRSAR